MCQAQPLSREGAIARQNLLQPLTEPVLRVTDNLRVVPNDIAAAPCVGMRLHRSPELTGHGAGHVFAVSATSASRIRFAVCLVGCSPSKLSALPYVESWVVSTLGSPSRTTSVSPLPRRYLTGTSGRPTGPGWGSPTSAPSR